ncbi:hypothetical protein AAFF_G00402600 [Aldrovandia affinis]|uniref:Uncharacterized protein n=1 Tax=Aldrovandia affinis TaxID=143900 RepID=A0AAD7T7P1_9TELE|nr:hypothetical protein AAFF_G00402600 [Aldrovandia affinis]
MSLCLSSQLHHLGGARAGGGAFILDPHGFSSSVRVQEKSAWRMCVGSSGSLDAPPPLPRPQAGATLRALDLAQESSAFSLKHRVLQLPLCDRTISVNIQRNPQDHPLCGPAPPTCCQVI